VSKRSREEPLDDELVALIEGSIERWTEGAFEEALHLAEKACERAPRSAQAHHSRAAALATLERVEEAREACDLGLELAPDDAEALLFAADFYVTHFAEDDEAVEKGLALARRGAKNARASRDDELEAELLLVQAAAHEELLHMREALACVESALDILGPDSEVMLEHSIILFELGRFEEAQEELGELAHDEPHLAAAHHYLGLLDERRGDQGSARRHFARAHELDPEGFPGSVKVAPKEFDQILEDALGRLPARIREYLANVAVTVEDVPAEEDLRAAEPPHSPQTLGMYRGEPLTDAGHPDPWVHFPRSIVLYQRNLERAAENREDLVEQIGITLLHEVGHFLGLDEEELKERGLD
jgi:predicted Zn-dependent protease with MMP-like domain